jgi:hypothetical protein
MDLYTGGAKRAAKKVDGKKKVKMGASGIPRYGSKVRVYNGKAEQTPGGLKKADIKVVQRKKKDGTITNHYMSKKKSAAAAHNTKRAAWVQLVQDVYAKIKPRGKKFGDAMTMASDLKKKNPSTPVPQLIRLFRM